jgi:hypothetical protein
VRLEGLGQLKNPQKFIKNFDLKILEKKFLGKTLCGLKSNN